MTEFFLFLLNVFLRAMVSSGMTYENRSLSVYMNYDGIDLGSIQPWFAGLRREKDALYPPTGQHAHPQPPSNVTLNTQSKQTRYLPSPTVYGVNVGKGRQRQDQHRDDSYMYSPLGGAAYMFVDILRVICLWIYDKINTEMIVACILH